MGAFLDRDTDLSTRKIFKHLRKILKWKQFDKDTEEGLFGYFSDSVTHNKNTFGSTGFDSKQDILSSIELCLEYWDRD